DEPAGFFCSLRAFHVRVLPLDGEDALIADRVQRPNDPLPVQPSPPRTSRIPATPRIIVGKIRPQQPGPAVEGDYDVLDVDVEDRVRELAQERDGVDPLPVQVRWVEEEAELLAATQRVEDHLGGVEIEGHLPGMDLAGVANTALLTDIKDGR